MQSLIIMPVHLHKIFGKYHVYFDAILIPSISEFCPICEKWLKNDMVTLNYCATRFLTLYFFRSICYAANHMNDIN